MMISKALFIVICLSSAFGGAVLSAVIVSTSTECSIGQPTPEQQKAADDFWKEGVKQGKAKGY